MRGKFRNRRVYGTWQRNLDRCPGGAGCAAVIMFVYPRWLPSWPPPWPAAVPRVSRSAPPISGRSGNVRKDASEAAKAVAETEWLAAPERITRDTADRAIDDGSVFDRSQMSEEAKQQLDAYRKGGSTGGLKEGAHAKRLATALPGNTVPAMEGMLDAEVAAGHCKRANEPQPGPTRVPQIQPTYYFHEGSVVRLKPQGDAYNNWQPSFSVEVKNVGVSASAASEQPDIAFKLDNRGRAVPKSPNEIANPYSSGKNVWQRNRFENFITYAGHQLAR
jgi:hypothetical protein